jgi:hypothetical protein
MSQITLRLKRIKADIAYWNSTEFIKLRFSLPSSRLTVVTPNNALMILSKHGTYNPSGCKRQGFSLDDRKAFGFGWNSRVAVEAVSFCLSFAQNQCAVLR